MPVKRLPFILLASTLFSGCSTSQIAENWHTPSAWFGTEEENQTKDPLDSQQVVVAKGDEDLKADVAAGNGEDSASGAPLDDAISPELQAKAQQAREKLDNPARQSDASTRTDDLWSRLRAGFTMDHSVDNARVQAQLDWYVRHPPLHRSRGGKRLPVPALHYQ